MSGSATNKPWKKPGQTSQNKSMQPPKNPVQQEKRKKRAQASKAGGVTAGRTPEGLRRQRKDPYGPHEGRRGGGRS